MCDWDDAFIWGTLYINASKIFHQNKPGYFATSLHNPFVLCQNDVLLDINYPYNQAIWESREVSYDTLSLHIKYCVRSIIYKISTVCQNKEYNRCNTTWNC